MPIVSEKLCVSSTVANEKKEVVYFVISPQGDKCFTQHASQSFLMFIFLEFVMRQYPPKIAHSPTWLAKVMKGP